MRSVSVSKRVVYCCGRVPGVSCRLLGPGPLRHSAGVPFEQRSGLENPLSVGDHLSDDALKAPDQLIEGPLGLPDDAAAGPDLAGEVAVTMHGADVIAQGLEGLDEIYPEPHRCHRTDEHPDGTTDHLGQGCKQPEDKGGRVQGHGPTDPSRS